MRLTILSVSPFPASPPIFGAQRRIQGLLASLAKRHVVDAVSLVPPYLDAAVADHAMREYCRKVVLVPSGPSTGPGKRFLQIRSLLSTESYERRYYSIPALQRALDTLLGERQYDIVHVESCFLSHCRVRQAPHGQRPPRTVLDEHNVEFDLTRQMTGLARGVGRHLHNSLNWRKIRREEFEAWRRFDGVAFTSIADAERARASVPTVRACVVPNAVDVEFFRTRSGDLASDGRTILFFGTFNYFPNRDGILFFLREVWPRVSANHPYARLKIVGADPPPEVLAYKDHRVEVAGVVDDLRPHLAEAAVAIAPLLIGGGTRLKIVEAMAMARPVVSTSLGAEGIAATPEREILIADGPAAFAAAIGRILDDRALGARIGEAARALVVARFSWEMTTRPLERLYFDVLEEPRPSNGAGVTS